MSKGNNQLFEIETKEKGFKLPDIFLNLKTKPNTHLIHLSVLRHLANRRAGTASTKTRAEVRGGGKKPWRQKGTGRARVGSIRSPLWVGGGIIFGPKPRDFDFAIPKKARNLALLETIASKKEDISVVKGLENFSSFKTKDLFSNIKSLGLDENYVLFVCSGEEKNFENVKRAARNIKKIFFIDEKYLSVYDVIRADKFLITKDALNKLSSRLSKTLDRKKAEKETNKQKDKGIAK